MISNFEIAAIVVLSVIIIFCVGYLIAGNIKKKKKKAKEETETPANPEKIKEYEGLLKQLCRNSVNLEISGKTAYIRGATRFGGVPDVPENFEWPYFTTDGMDDKEVKPRPLAFLAQFNLAEIALYDNENLLPKTGILSFFYETDSMRWGYQEQDRGCAKVFWFEDVTALSAATCPSDLTDEKRFPALNIKLKNQKSYPDGEDFYVAHELDYRTTIDDFLAAEKALGVEIPENCSKLLGWANHIQGNMTCDCELIDKGYDTTAVWNGGMPKDQLRKIELDSLDWILLFQLDTVEHDGFELMFGDEGRIYFYIKKEHLLKKRFDKVWLVLQCG